MVDLNVMMREQARSGLETQLEAAVTNGDTEAAKKIAKQIEEFGAASAPARPPYGDAEIRAELEKTDWFGVDGRKTATALQFGKDMNIKKFATPAEFAKALVKSVDEHYAPPTAAAPPKKEGEGEGDDDGEGEGGEGDDPPTAKKPARRSDGPGEGDALGNRPTGGSSGPWTKLSQAPREVQAEINRVAAKQVPANATKEVRAKFISDMLASSYTIHQRNKGKK